jgi:hypothetical protein
MYEMYTSQLPHETVFCLWRKQRKKSRTGYGACMSGQMSGQMRAHAGPGFQRALAAIALRTTETMPPQLPFV